MILRCKNKIKKCLMNVCKLNLNEDDYFIIIRVIYLVNFLAPTIPIMV